MIGNIVTGALTKAAILGDFESIATTIVGAGGVSDVTFSSIPSTYQHLQIRYIMRNNTSTSDRMRVQLNSDSGSNYALHLLEGNGASVIAAAATSQTRTIGSATTASTDTSNVFVGGIIDILDYKDTNKNTTLRSLSGADRNGSGEIDLWSGFWANTAAVTTVRLFIPSLSFAQNSHFALYGIKG